MHRARVVQVGERAEEEAVDDAEHGDIGADAECEGEDDRCGEGARLAEAAQRMARVAQERVEPWDPVSAAEGGERISHGARRDVVR